MTRISHRIGGIAESATLAITGFPLTAGFISKDLILWNAWGSTFAGAACRSTAPTVATCWGCAARSATGCWR